MYEKHGIFSVGYGAPGRIRTNTEQVLNLLPLPVGLQGQLGWGSTIRTYTTRSKVEGSTVKLFPTEVAGPMILKDLARFDWGSGQDPPQVGLPTYPILGSNASPTDSQVVTVRTAPAAHPVFRWRRRQNC